ncbi:MAG: glycosyl hydrolase 115 family protein [Prevotella sp.]|nr:glycosyl hydrolase 115 family protein [Prevotella sp.]
MNTNIMIRKTIILCFCIFVGLLQGRAADPFVSFTSGVIDLTHPTIYVDRGDERGVMLAARNLVLDFGRVTGTDATLASDERATILVGTIGHSPAIDRLVKQGKIDGKQLRGKTEKFIITVVGTQLVIAGSDRRGTIYGIYELSRQIGVSPWYWWADVPTVRRSQIYARAGIYTDGEPAVRYRGIFLNDEAPCLTSWVHNYFKTRRGGHEFYAKCFELLLRLKANFMWPAMWSWAFYADDPLNSKTADEMGIIMGTSHHEPMARNHQEYASSRSKWGTWDYTTNQEQLDRFFREGIERIKGKEDVVTIGMRGDGDAAMSEEADTKLMQKIVNNQRKIIADVTRRPASETPQVWALYKEVLDYYDKGMRVPDDVTLLLCDDNWGNVRRVPSPKEKARKGGWGLYYHVDYVGAPRNTKWLNVTPTQNMWEQLQLAYTHGIERLWVLNVGDLKPMEYPIQFFLDMAWNPQRYQADNIVDHTRQFCQAAWGEQQADEVARILNLQGKYAGRCTAEMLDAKTYNLETGEWRRVADDYVRLEADALNQYLSLRPEQQDSYRELVLFPVQAMSNLYQMYYAQAMNHALYEQNDPETDEWATRVEQAFKRDSLLCAAYNHDIAGGKWNGMMTQKHIGYTSWNDNFKKDTCPKVYRLDNNKASAYTFSEHDGQVVMEATHYHEANDDGEGRWTVLPFVGRSRDAIALMPYTVQTGKSNLVYRFNTSTKVRTVKIHVVVKSTLDYMNVGGMVYSVTLDGQSTDINFNKDLNELPKNIYSVYYPTVARRAVESIVELPIAEGQSHKLTLQPKSPGIVFEKIVVDLGGYKPQYLFGEESPYTIFVDGSHESTK